MANVRCDTDKDPLKIKRGNFATLKGNSFYEKRIENLGTHKSTKFLGDEWVVNKALRPPFLKIEKKLVGSRGRGL